MINSDINCNIGPKDRRQYVEGFDAVSQLIRNTLTMDPGESFFGPGDEIGLKDFLFETDDVIGDELTLSMLATRVQQLVPDMKVDKNRSSVKVVNGTCYIHLGVVYKDQSKEIIWRIVK